jgi:prevent-host-death family protein
MTRKKSVSLLMLRSREIAATEFKSRCLEIMDEVERLGTEVTITKHRRPVARLVPIQQTHPGFCGSLKDMIVSMGDVENPVDVEWEYDESNLT